MNNFDKELSQITSDQRIQKMRQYVQHGNVSTFDHCCSVARTSCRINRALGLHADEETLLKGAVLHDYYLYDWHHEDNGEHKWHGFTHARAAADNASRHFGIDSRTKQVIISHMWPLTLRQIPKSREAWIVCLADKYVSLNETLFHRS